MKIYEFERDGRIGALSDDGQLFIASVKNLTADQRRTVYASQYGEGCDVVVVAGSAMDNPEFAAAYSRRLAGASVKRTSGGEG